MWYFDSPRIVFGEDAVSHLRDLRGSMAFIVTDKTMVRLGFVGRVKQIMEEAGFRVAVFDEVEADPSVQTVLCGAAAMRDHSPDWILGLGGGSCMDAAKAMWILYERPEVTPEQINPFDTYDLRQKARFVAIPTTSGTGSEVTWAIVLTDTHSQRKMGLGTRECIPDYAIVDPFFVRNLPASITADTGMDALSHAFEAYVNTWHNDYTDGLALQAIRLVFEYLPRAVADGGDLDAREHMHNAASIAGLAFGNSLCALAHSLGHSLGAVFHCPHGRAVGLFLPYTIEFFAPGGSCRYGDIAHLLGIHRDTEGEAGIALASHVRALATSIGQPLSIADAGITSDAFRQNMEKLVDNAETDTQTIASPRVPTREEFERLFWCAYEGRSIDF